MTKAAPQTAAEPDRPESGRDSHSFTFADRSVTLYRPTSGQEYILLTLLNLGDESASTAEVVRTIRTFGAMLSSLFTVEAELDYVLGLLARGGDIEDFIDLAEQMAEHWDIERDEEPANRQARRAAERRPVGPAKRAARPRR